MRLVFRQLPHFVFTARPSKSLALRPTRFLTIHKTIDVLVSNSSKLTRPVTNSCHVAGLWTVQGRKPGNNSCRAVHPRWRRQPRCRITAISDSSEFSMRSSMYVLIMSSSAQATSLSLSLSLSRSLSLCLSLSLSERH